MVWLDPFRLVMERKGFHISCRCNNYSLDYALFRVLFVNHISNILFCKICNFWYCFPNKIYKCPYSSVFVEIDLCLKILCYKREDSRIHQHTFHCNLPSHSDFYRQYFRIDRKALHLSWSCWFCLSSPWAGLISFSLLLTQSPPAFSIRPLSHLRLLLIYLNSLSRFWCLTFKRLF